MPKGLLCVCPLGLWGLANAGINEPTFLEMAKAPQAFRVWALGIGVYGLGFGVLGLGLGH